MIRLLLDAFDLYYKKSRPMQINFREKSTAGETIRVDSIKLSQINNIFQPRLHRPGALYFLSLTQIDFGQNELTAGEIIRVDSIKSSRIDNIFNPSCIVQERYIFDSRGNDSCRLNQIELNRQHFQPILHGSGALYFLSLLQIDFRYDDSTLGEMTRVDSI